jgi:predicted secreted protein
MKLLLVSVFFYSCHHSSLVSPTGDSIIRVKQNQAFEIRLGADFASGYSWSSADSSYKIFLSLDTVYSVNKTDQDGSPSIQVMRYHTLKKGECRLHLVYIHPWMEFTKPRKEVFYDIRID